VTLVIVVTAAPRHLLCCIDLSESHSIQQVDLRIYIPTLILNLTSSFLYNLDNVYIADCDNNVVRKVTVSTGIISTIAGTDASGYSGDGGPATSAEMSYPFGITVDSQGNVFIADSDNNRIRKLTVSTGIINTVAGSGSTTFSGDNGAATSATLNRPNGVALDSAGKHHYSGIIPGRSVTFFLNFRQHIHRR